MRCMKLILVLGTIKIGYTGPALRVRLALLLYAFLYRKLSSVDLMKPGNKGQGAGTALCILQMTQQIEHLIIAESAGAGSGIQVSRLHGSPQSWPAERELL